MTLYDRLSEENKQLLNDQAEEFPLATESIINTLKSKHYVNELTIGEAISAAAWVNVLINVSDLYELFNK